jgi:peroxiredoxin
MKNEHLTPRDAVLTAGEPAPDFTLLDQDRNEWKLSDALEKGDVVLSFYPMSFTGVCGTEMECITKEMARWQDQGAQIVGVSCDSFAVQKAWADQGGFKQTLLADMHREVCKAYGLYWADLNVASRGTVIVTKGDAGPVVKWSQAREVMNAMDFDEVLAAMG